MLCDKTWASLQLQTILQAAGMTPNTVSLKGRQWQGCSQGRVVSSHQHGLATPG